MPLTSKGEEILANMKKEYGPEKGEQVLYASKNAGTVTGIDQGIGEMPVNPFPEGSGQPVATAAPALQGSVAGDPLGKDVAPRDAAPAEASQLEGMLPPTLSTSELAARSREIWERGPGRPAPAGVYGDSKPGRPR